MSDNYEFEKSRIPQGVDYETPYAAKNWAYIPDINSGIYNNSGGPCLVNFDLTSIFNSQMMVDPSQMFVAVPIILVSALVSNPTNATLNPPQPGYAWSYAGLKSGYWNLIHQADLTINGKTIEMTQPYLNVYTNMRMLSQMSQDDLKTLGMTLGMGEILDNPQSLKFSSPAAPYAGTASGYPPTGVGKGYTGVVGGNGLSNNLPFTLTDNTGNYGDLELNSSEYYLTYNIGYYSRLKKHVDITQAGSATGSNLFGTSVGTNENATTIMSQSQLNNEFKSYCSIESTNYAVIRDVAIIRLCDIFDSMKQLPLMKRFDATLRIYFNCGAVASSIEGSVATGAMLTSLTTNTFTNTCPIMQSCIGGTTAIVNSTYGATTNGIISGLGISTAPITNLFGGVNLSNSLAKHQMSSCRVYYPQIVLKPEMIPRYISENRNKKIVYTTMLFNQANNIQSGSTFSNIIQNGIQNARGVFIVPFNSASLNGKVNATTISGGITTFSQLQSPFDTAPATSGPFSLTNLQVNLGGVNVLNNILSYSWENFIEQISLYEKINASDLGLSCGLMNEFYWSNANRIYYVDLTRCNLSDLNTPKNLSVTFNNNTNCTLDVMFFTEYFKEIVVDVETGACQV